MPEFKYKITLHSGYSYIYTVHASNKLDAWAKVNDYLKSTYANPDDIECYHINTDTYNNMKKENIVNFDFQGWPEFKMSIKDIIERIGGKLNEETNKWEIPNESWMTQCPTIIHDDGMGYGTDPEYIIDIDFDKIGQTCNVWADKKLDNVELYAETGFYPGSFFKIGDKEYCVNDLCYTDVDHSTCIVRAMEWIYSETTDENGNIKIENPVGPYVDFDLRYVLDNMNKDVK